MFLTSSVTDLPKIFEEGLIKGLLNGLVVFWNSGGWFLAVLLVVWFILKLIFSRHRFH